MTTWNNKMRIVQERSETFKYGLWEKNNVFYKHKKYLLESGEVIQKTIEWIDDEKTYCTTYNYIGSFAVQNKYSPSDIDMNLGYALLWEMYLLIREYWDRNYPNEVILNVTMRDGMFRQYKYNTMDVSKICIMETYDNDVCNDETYMKCH